MTKGQIVNQIESIERRGLHPFFIVVPVSKKLVGDPSAKELVRDLVIKLMDEEMDKVFPS